MKKFKVLVITILFTPILAGLYGVLHDQFTYTISNEYFTKFKFVQFGLVDQGKAILSNNRMVVAIVGFLATWWTGIFIGIGHGLTGLIHSNAKIMQRTIIKAIVLNMGIAAVTGLMGYCYGKLYLANTQVNWWFPDNLIDKKAFIAAGSMHNFSYLGGAIGLFAGIVYQLRVAGKINILFPLFNRQSHKRH
ncbi:hypothetical protein HQ865_06525 [Mucilaginibacter mali]|uniref:Signal peptide-containing protein n=1 Tax=Mucilaginibacter mali TaxID=2740462 RepID=A0A7D4Q9J8_9SPHI|nr:hypothetical protein [Mucilaginibacter mali]QKJ29424.1 hypothetical protein HQ865_06525 [Mucilaginibacter mali]